MIMTAETAELRELELFTGLPDDDLRYIAGLVHRTTVPAGTLLISAQLPGEAVYFILEGSVKVQFVSEDGSEYTVALLGPGDMVGETSSGNRHFSTANVVTRQQTSLLWIDRRAFLRCHDVTPARSRNLPQELSERLRLANEQIQSLATLDVPGRVACQILELAERYGQSVPGDGIHIQIPVTQGEIAEMIAATRERVNQIMVRLKRAGVFSVDPDHRITVHRPEVLVELCRM
jgi:CRP/FNR family cyclic AMP-dependent transcriptional regulator